MIGPIYLDSGPLWLLIRASGESKADECREWLRALEDSGIRVVVPEIVDYEVRRELTRRNATAGLRRLDSLLTYCPILPLNRPAMLLAAELWAIARRSGVPTADPHALDGDVILAAQALTAMGSGNIATIATGNVGHLARFAGIDARDWQAIA